MWKSQPELASDDFHSCRVFPDDNAQVCVCVMRAPEYKGKDSMNHVTQMDCYLLNLHTMQSVVIRVDTAVNHGILFIYLICIPCE